MKNLLIRFSVLCLAIATVSCSKDSSSNKTFTPKVSAVDVAKIVPTGMQTANPEAYAMISEMSGYMAMPAAFMQNPHGKRVLPQVLGRKGSILLYILMVIMVRNITLPM